MYSQICVTHVWWARQGEGLKHGINLESSYIYICMVGSVGVSNSSPIASEGEDVKQYAYLQQSWK